MVMELYHVLNRGVDRRNIYMDAGDRVRFVHNLYEFNDVESADKTFRRVMDDFVSRPLKRERLVDIHGWCLMDNHYHLLISEIAEGGMTLFLRKLNIGYAKFFNEKYHREGALFQGRTKKVLIENDAQFLYILHYIHLNALDFLHSARDWRVRDYHNIKSARAALDYLKDYRWSSYQDYIGKKNFPSIIKTQFFDQAYGNYYNSVSDFLRSAEDDDHTSLHLE